MTRKGKEAASLAVSSDFYGLTPDTVRTLIYGVIGCSVVLMVVLFHVLSVSIDKAIAGAYEQTPSTSLEITNEGIVKTSDDSFTELDTE
jgi:hypothetical protein